MTEKLGKVYKVNGDSHRKIPISLLRQLNFVNEYKFKKCTHTHTHSKVKISQCVKGQCFSNNHKETLTQNGHQALHARQCNISGGCC